MKGAGFRLLAGVLWATPMARGAEVTYDVRPEYGALSPVFVVRGEPVGYEVFIAVNADDNDGLNFFSFDVLTDLEIEQSLDNTEFDALILSLFDFLGPNLGEVDGDDILGFEGTQGFGNDSTTGVGQDGPQVLVHGKLVTPNDRTGVFAVRVSEDTNTQLLAIGGGLIADSAITTTVGPGFEIQLLDPEGDLDDDGVPNKEDNCPGDANADQADADSDGVGDACDGVDDGGDDNGDGGGDGGGDGNGNGGNGETPTGGPGNFWDFLLNNEIPPMAVALVLFFVPVVFGFLIGGPIFGPLGFVIGLIMASTALLTGSS